jgi:lipid A ethanolaminephosphotransferase
MERIHKLRLSFAATWTARPELGIETTIALVSVFLATAANGPFWHAALAGRSLNEAWTWRFAIATLIALVALQYFAIGLLATRHIVRPLLAVLIVASVLAAHFMQRYGVVLDASMLRNVLHTDLREATELMGLDFLGTVLIGLTAAGLLWAVRLPRRTPRRALLVRACTLGACFLVGAGALSIAFQDLGSLMRNDRKLRYTITPGNIVWSLGQVLARDIQASAAVRDPSEPAFRTVAAPASRKPTLLVIVVGETARAANFSLDGYARATNPELARLDVINFAQTTACGTSTEVSLPCMFSPFGRADYDEQHIRRHESLLHLVSRAGMRVVWLDNQSGCKGVCDGLEFRDLSREQVPGLCAEGRCYDEVLLHKLARIVEGLRGDTVVVLHQLGNHGPAYFRRYPPEFKRFVPACESTELRKCTREQIVNAYDNAIAYTDHFLASTIRFLDRQRSRFDVAMVYASDHGESLGELGLYLHGIPYAIAPREQVEVPMLWWLPAESARALGIDSRCVRASAGKQVSHDNLFHSVLGLLAIVTPRYKSERDVFNACHSVRPGTRHQIAAADDLGAARLQVAKRIPGPKLALATP